MKLDHVNRRIIESLQRELGISETAVRARVQKLTEAGVIEVVAVTNPLMVGFDVMAMIGVKASGRLQEIPGRVPSLTELPTACAFAPRCPRADQLSHSQVPELREIEPRHLVACFHPGPAA